MRAQAATAAVCKTAAVTGGLVGVLLSFAGCVDWDGTRSAFHHNNSNGAAQHVFSKSLGGLGLESVNALARVKKETVLGGLYTGATRLGPEPLPERGGTDAFVGRFSESGAHLWSKGYGGNGNEQVRAIAVDSQGAVYVTGELASASFDYGFATPLLRTGIVDAFVLRLTPEGESQWGLGISGSSAQVRGRALALLPDDSALVVAGAFLGSVSFAGAPAVNAASDGFFAVKVLPSGTVQNVVAQGTCSSGAFVEHNVVVDSQKEIYLVGIYDGACTLAGESLPSPSPGGSGVFVFKMGVAGALQWKTAFPNADAANRLAIALDRKDHLLVAGSFRGAISLTSGQTIESRSRTSTDAFVLKLDRLSGSILWGVSEGGTGTDEVWAVAVDNENQPSVTGGFQGSVTTRSGKVLQSAGDFDVWLLRYSEGGEGLNALSYGDGQAQSGRALGVDAQGWTLAGTLQGTVDFGGGPISAQGSDLFFVQLQP